MKINVNIGYLKRFFARIQKKQEFTLASFFRHKTRKKIN